MKMNHKQLMNNVPYAHTCEQRKETMKLPTKRKFGVEKMKKVHP